ncbi:TetR/AcrR family transcriptional regulator [Sphingobium sp. CAP-1]|uniref:TetR/AcrR family transcriptional regulator n=1 Tax=Sphingobium sp. CAP-1 TaxID=2676077 RepID=UPI0018AD0F21|nr:TetR/AcrR family transcriptional regulator [Sphingobium sp. CAP-1]
MPSSQGVKAATLHNRRAGRPSAREAELKHEAMLEAALEEFARAGFHGASIRAIADKAGLSTRTLYNRYPDKAALFAACLEMSSLRVQYRPSDKPGTLYEQLVHFGRIMQAKLNEDRSTRLARVILREAASFPQLRDISQSQFHRFQLGPVQRILEAHGFPTDQAERLGEAYATLAFQKWQARTMYNEAPLTPAEIDQQIESATTLFLSGALASL